MPDYIVSALTHLINSSSSVTLTDRPCGQASITGLSRGFVYEGADLAGPLLLTFPSHGVQQASAASRSPAGYSFARWQVAVKIII